MKSLILFLFIFVSTIYSQAKYEIQVIKPLGITNLSNIDKLTFWISTSDISPTDYSEFENYVDIPDESWKPINVPQDLSQQGIKFQKKFWYRKVFFITGELKNSLSIRLGEISDRDKVYLNGILIGSHGEFGSEFPQGYDKQRIYDIPIDVLKLKEPNTLLIEVEPYFETEYGIYRDKVEIGPTKDLWREFYLENFYQLLMLMIYFSVGSYFLLFYIRRRSEKENLYFSLFLFGLIIYSFLKTQWKYEFSFSFYRTKQLQFISVISLAPPFYFFFRNYFKNNLKFPKFIDWFFIILNLVVLISALVIVFHPSVVVWDSVLNFVVQPSWLIYTIGILSILGISAFKKDIDAFLMIGGALILVGAMILDALAGRGIINIPSVLTFAFATFIISIALVLANRFVNLHNETESLNDNLSKLNKASSLFVPFEFLRILEKDSILNVNLGDQVQKEMTVLFSDIRSFTTLSENMSPKDNFDFINSYLSRVGPHIRQNNGFIDKYIGDAVMALFAHSPEDALKSAIGMQKEVQKHNIVRVSRGDVAISIGVGIHIGKLMLGTIGEKERMEGTVISDSVNLASRLESLTKMYGASIILSDAAVDKIPVIKNYNYRYIDRVKVKGKSEAISIYEFYDGDSDSRINFLKSIDLEFKEGINFFYKKDFLKAKNSFLEILKKGDDIPSSIFLKRCDEYMIQLPKDYDGTEKLDSK